MQGMEMDIETATFPSRDAVGTVLYCTVQYHWYHINIWRRINITAMYLVPEAKEVERYGTCNRAIRCCVYTQSMYPDSGSCRTGIISFRTGLSVYKL